MLLEMMNNRIELNYTKTHKGLGEITKIFGNIF